MAVEAVIVKENKIFIAKRADDREHMPGVWECLTGRVEQNETLEDAVKREVKEETTLEVEIVEPINTFHFYRNSKEKEHQGVSFWCRYISGEVVIDSSEHSEYKWITPEEALNIITLESIKESVRKISEIAFSSCCGGCEGSRE